MKNTSSASKKLVPGSKVSISVLIDYVKDGYSVGEFLSDYPWIKKENVDKVLDTLKNDKYPTRYAF